MVEGILEVDVAGGCVVELSGAGELHDVGLITCVGQVFVQGDEGPVDGVAQGVEDHGVTGVRHEQEVEGEKEENNTQGRRHMCMDGMKVKRQMRSALSQSEDVNTSDDATTDCVQCAQCCMVSSSACVALFTLLFTMRSMSVRMCLYLCTIFRSLLSYILFVNFWFRMYCIYNIWRPFSASRRYE